MIMLKRCDGWLYVSLTSLHLSEGLTENWQITKYINVKWLFIIPVAFTVMAFLISLKHCTLSSDYFLFPFN